MLRDDNAGLGVQKGKSNADTFGLATLSGIFGRLNGKSEVEVQKQADTHRDLELQTYQSQKWGMMNFVYGGLLVGDKMEEGEKERLAKHNADFLQSKRKAEEDAPTETSSKKRKHGSGKSSEAASESSDESDAEAEKTKKKQKERSKKGEAVADSPSEAVERASKKERKEKKHKKDDKSGEPSDKAQAKEEKRARKEARRKRREEKQARKAAKGKTSAQTSRDQSSDSSEDEADAPTPKPTTPSFASGRLAVRQRYIMQKRQAGMNPQAMAEILMLKAGA